MEEVYIGMYDFGSPEYDEAVALRTEVLRKPLNMEYTEAQLAAEYSDFHFGIWGQQGLLATLILTDLGDGSAKMRQVAVDPGVQGRGLGKKLVAFCEEWARTRGFQKLVLHARLTAVPFYLSMSYEVMGEEFTEVGIPHLKMYKSMV